MMVTDNGGDEDINNATPGPGKTTTQSSKKESGNSDANYNSPYQQIRNNGRRRIYSAYIS